MTMHQQNLQPVDPRPPLRLLPKQGLSDDPQDDSTCLSTTAHCPTPFSDAGINGLRIGEPSAQALESLDVGLLTREIERLEAIAGRQAELMTSLRNERSKVLVERNIDRLTREAFHQSRLSIFVKHTFLILLVACASATIASSVLSRFHVVTQPNYPLSVAIFTIGALVGAGSVLFFRD